MKVLFKEMDIYKAIILVCIFLIPVAVGFVYWVEGRIETAERSLARATAQPSGDLARIGVLRQGLDTIKKVGQRSFDKDNHYVFFQRQIVESSRDGELGANNIDIGAEGERRVSKPKSVDKEVTIDFKREGKELPLPRELISVILFNCERFDVWKLRSLDIRNQQIAELGRGVKTPPKTIGDVWRVYKMTFARREPIR